MLWYKKKRGKKFYYDIEITNNNKINQWGFVFFIFAYVRYNSKNKEIKSKVCLERRRGLEIDY